jgi:hypothetical protein
VAISSVNVDDDDQDVLNVLVFDGDLSELAAGSGRVLVGHGFDAMGFENVDVILPATCAMDGALVPDLARCRRSPCERLRGWHRGARQL